MKVVVSATGDGLDTAVSPVFGRCPFYLFVDTESMEWSAVANPAMGASGGAGIQAAQFVVEQGAEAALTGNVGPNAMDVLNAAGVAVYPVAAGTVQEAVDAFKTESLSKIVQPTAPADTGKAPVRTAGTAMNRTTGQGANFGTGRGRGRGGEQGGAGRGQCRGGGRGGRGGGRGRA